ncbi:histidine kinase dimerization/phosphoacceptor domain -containing protein [Hymenobacter wooponensis]|uniref:histidine kinase n=1 Tax=Hymenobacter wooponensis TaxID=1525360 RepID=A0A4Z0MSX9_9BACT|nr:histidine kinase dimerization/phosphoacceptor domain -containing protein [Hymenobacter wooponensis]TGD82549.1 tetratricopeptide repeat protein [Hymenobacter wooponensis]
MSLPRPFGKLLLLLLTVSLSAWGEPLYPLLSPAQVSQLQTRLRQAQPDTGRLQVLLQLSGDLIAKHDELGAPLGNAEAYCRQAQALSQAQHDTVHLIESLYYLGQIRAMAGNNEAGQRLIRRALQLSRQINAKQQEAIGWYYLGNTYPRVEQEFPAKIRCYQQARERFQQLGGKAEEAYLLKTIADMHLLQGNSAQAISELLQVASLYQKAGQRKLHYTYDLLRGAHRQMGNYKEALRYGLASIESAQTTHDTSAIGGFYARTASLYVELQQYPEALRYYEKSLTNFRQTGVHMESVAGEMARVLIAQHKPEQALKSFLAYSRQDTSSDPKTAMYRALYLAECYLALKRYARAEQHYLQLIQLTKSGIDDDINKLVIYQAIGKFYLQTNQYDKARSYLAQALYVSKRSGYLLRVAEIHLLLFKTDSAQAHYPAAIAHYQAYKALNDSIFSAAKNKQLASLQIQYDTHKKEQNIALLTKQTQAQQARLKQQEFQRNAVAVGALLLVLVLGLGYNRYRLKQHSNLLLEAKQAEINQQNQALQALLLEKDWMLKEIHHRVKNNLEVINSLLETQADYLRDPAAMAALREGQNRVHAMALIHQKLYQSNNLAVVDMQSYIRGIVEHLLESFDCQESVQVQLGVEAVELEVQLATPLGLIINEALTNALKYAFPNQQGGTVTIGLASLGHRHYQLLIEDDGVGFPPEFDPEDDQTMGLTIMRGLSGQMDGTMRITQSRGVRISLAFEDVLNVKRSVPLLG